MLFFINPLFLISFCCQKPVEWHTAPRTEIIGWDRLESPSVNLLLTTKLLSLDPLSWDMDCLLTLWPLLIPCSLGNGCCMFGFLIFIIVERNFLYNSLHILTERSWKHPSSTRGLGPRVFLFLSLSLSLSPSPANYLEHKNPTSSFFCLGFQDPWSGCPVPSRAVQALIKGFIGSLCKPGNISFFLSFTFLSSTLDHQVLVH